MLVILLSNFAWFESKAKLTLGSLEAAGESKTGQGEGTEAEETASVTEQVVKLALAFKQPARTWLLVRSVRLNISYCKINIVSEFRTDTFAPHYFD